METINDLWKLAKENKKVSIGIGIAVVVIILAIV